MPAPVHAQRSRMVRRVPPVRRNVKRKVVRSVRRRRRPRSQSSSRSRSSSSTNSSRSRSHSPRSHSHKHKQSRKRRLPHSLLRRSNSVMPLYGTNGTMIVGYVRPCRAGVRLWYPNLPSFS
ncbi:hypothetical protein LOAG_18131 [Loa loa]|uniref:Capsid protein n=1 Tax=Loa loa TaxID=7209 RepID=A0A1I7W1H1_LOALO|nr:hypothetical protein LOAG_18131 [Loa loa]EJD74562.1 hypothetical protein LOAG_18131 [Loa loa]